MTVDELIKTHPDYDAFLPEWQFYIRAYLGGKFYREGDYLLQHPFESETNYQRRKRIAYYYNYCKPIVDIYSSFLYIKSPLRSYGPLSSEVVPPRKPKTLFDSFWWDVDYEGKNLNQFVRRAQSLADVYGRVSIIVDKPSVSALTRAQALEQDIRPYLTLVTPENMLDWEYSRINGRPVLTFVKIREGVDLYRIWRRNGWELWRIDREDEKNTISVLVEAGEYNLGEIPIVNLYSRHSGIRMVGTSLLQDIADINKNIYYLCSDAKEIIENTAYPMLAMPYDKGGEAEQPVGPKNILQFDPETPSALPQWLEPPHSSLAEIRSWVQQDAQEIARIALLGGVRNVEGSTQPWSGVSIRQQKDMLKASLVEMADNAEQSELDILRLWCKWEQISFEGNILYNKEFDIEDLTIALQNAITAGTAKISSSTFEKARQKKIVAAVLPEIEETEREAIFREIEDSEVAEKDDASEGITLTLEAIGKGNIESEEFQKALQKKLARQMLEGDDDIALDKIFADIEEA